MKKLVKASTTPDMDRAVELKNEGCTFAEAVEQMKREHWFTHAMFESVLAAYKLSDSNSIISLVECIFEVELPNE